MIEIFKPGGNARDQFFLFEEFFKGLKTALDDLPDGIERGPHPVFGDLKDGLLCLIEKALHILPILITLGDDVRGGFDQFSKDRLFFDDPGIILDIGGSGDGIDERGDVGGPADRIESDPSSGVRW